MKALRNLSAAALLAGLTLTTSLASADANDAETLFLQGLDAMKANNYAVACEAFDKSNRADASPGTQINLAICFEKEKKWASAWTWYRSAAGLAQQRNQPARVKSAEDSAARLKPTLHYVEINVKNPPVDAVVKRDGAEVSVALGGKPVPLPIDPGDHSIEVTASGKKTYQKTITMKDDPTTDHLEITLEDGPPEQTSTGAGPKTTTVIERSDGSTQRTLGVVLGVGGIAAGAAGVILEVLAQSEASKRDDLKKTANDQTLPSNSRQAAGTSADSHNSAANSDQLIAIGLGIGGVLMIGGGIALYLTAPRLDPAPPPSTGFHVKPFPIFTGTTSGMGLTGTF